MEICDGPQLLDRAKFCDDRGTFENIPLRYPDLGFEGKRVYICRNFQPGLVRAFHFHHYEAKIFICLQGAAKFVLLKGAYDKFTARGALDTTYVINTEGNNGVYIPPGYANGWQSLTPDTVILGISNRTVEESQKDDYRFSPTAEELEGTDFWTTKWR